MTTGCTSSKLHSLNIGPVCKTNIARVTQLFNKTNQLNLSTRRLSENEILEWANQSGHALLAASASDRFGDMGLVGVIGIAVEGVTGHLIDFILSCRVMWRKVEETMIHLAVAESKSVAAIPLLLAHYLPTARNRPTLDVFRNMGLSESDEHIFRFDIAKKVLYKPDAVTLVFPGAESGANDD